MPQDRTRTPPPPAAVPHDVADLRARQAAGLLHRRGLRHGDRVALLADNDPVSPSFTWGALRAGIVPVPLNTALTDAQLRELAVDADPALVVSDHANAGRLVLDRPGWTLDAATLDRERPAGEAPGDDDLSDVALGRAMHYTSGTTGRSKGVWTGVLAPQLARAWAADEAAANPSGPDDVHLVCSHLFHSGPHRYALNALTTGGRVVVLPRFDAGAALAAIERERVTTAFVVPTHLARILEHPDLATTDLSSLRWVHHAGAHCPEPLKRRALDALPDGVLHEFYGSTEGQFTAISPDAWLARPGSVGRPRPGRALEITDDDGRPLPAGRVGTVWVSAPPFARFSYWRDPGRTAAAWRGDRFTVGDLGHLDDDGWLHLSGRRSDLIVTGGVNVYPAEVESALLGHPQVLDAAVVGLPHPAWGQQVTAAVVPRPGATVEPAEVRAWLRERLAGFQTPKAVHVVADLPRTASGKVVRARLADDLAGAGEA